MRKYRMLSLAVSAVMAATVWASAANPIELYVSPGGNDGNIGSREKPMASLEAARDKLRTRAAGVPGVIRLLPGVHLRTKSFELGKGDSGVTICSAGGTGERAQVVGGLGVPGSAFRTVTDESILNRCDPAVRGKLVELDLAGLGLKNTGPFPDVFVGNGGLIDLYIDGERMPLSRWPNEDAYVTMAEVRDSGMVPKPHGGTFVYRGNRPAAWKSAIEGGGVWLVGFWRVPWICQSMRVSAINEAEKTITFAAPLPMGIGSKYSKEENGTRKGDGKEPWYVTNLLEEIDRPGEWCVDFAKRRLYLLPAQDLSKTRIVISDFREPVIAVRDAAGVTLSSFDVYGGLGDGVVLERATGSLVAGVNVLSAGSIGIRVAGGGGVKVRSCDVSNTGGVGIQVQGGDRKTLTPSNHEVSNNHVYLTGRNDRSTYAINIDGVSIRVANNLVHDTPLGGVVYGGNDHVMERNEVHNIGLEGGDLGAFYTNGDWAGRNNVVRHNLVHHAANCNGVYFDDGRSGDSALSNIFYKVRCGPFVGGGHDNTIRGNVVVDAAIGMHLDDRGLARKYTRNSKGALTRVLDTLDFTVEPWSSRYPGLIALLAKPDRLPYPTGNVLAGNLLIGTAKPTDFNSEQILRDNTASGNVVLSKEALAEFVAPERLDFRPASGAKSAGALEGFASYPFGKVGLEVDEYRTSLPTDESTGRLTPRKARTVFDSEVDVKRSNELGPPPAVKKP